MYNNIKTAIKLFLLKRKLKDKKKYFNVDDIIFKEKNVLIIDSITPEFDKDSGSRRLHQLILLMLKNDIGVFLLADLKEYKYKSEYIQSIKNMGVYVYEPSIHIKNGNLLTKKEFIKIISPKMLYAWLHRPATFKKYFKNVRQANEKIKIIYDMVDFHYVRLLREWQQNPLEKLKTEAQTYLEIELDNCKNADVVIAISDSDKSLLEEQYKNIDKVFIISNIHQYIKKNQDFTNFSNRSDLLFVGSFRHQPNIDAIFYLKNEIMPLIWKQNPNIKVNVVGSYVTNEILKFNSSNFKIIGFVEDIAPYFESSRLFVAPLRFGAGIKGKIGQSLEYSLPMVTTAVGAEGFDFGDQAEKMIADSKESIAIKILNLYESESLWDDASNSCESILEPFSLNKTEKSLLDIIN